jgi:transcriptional regulator with XRE-family HTH domain
MTTSRSQVLAKELTVACIGAGLTQRDIATRVGVSRARVGRLLRAEATVDIDLADAIARCCGHRLSMTIVPGDGVRLRDSGQLDVADAIRAAAHESLRFKLEVPVGRPPDRRAADMLMIHRLEDALIEIERSPKDWQAQHRRAQLKRVAYCEETGRSARLVIAIPDTVTSRRALAPYANLIREAFPVSSRRAWACIRSGETLAGDALLWVRL